MIQKERISKSLCLYLNNNWCYILSSVTSKCLSQVWNSEWTHKPEQRTVEVRRITPRRVLKRRKLQNQKKEKRKKRKRERKRWATYIAQVTRPANAFSIESSRRLNFMDIIIQLIYELQVHVVLMSEWGTEMFCSKDSLCQPAQSVLCPSVMLINQVSEVSTAT